LPITGIGGRQSTDVELGEGVFVTVFVLVVVDGGGCVVGCGCTVTVLVRLGGGVSGTPPGDSDGCGNPMLPELVRGLGELGVCVLVGFGCGVGVIRLRMFGSYGGQWYWTRNFFTYGMVSG
jgi:hypothetical protein